jgi:hypothetical protein
MPPLTGLDHFTIHILQRCRAYGAKVLSSTFGGGKRDKSSPWDHSGKDGVKMHPATKKLMNKG